jgi:hypothetical protein
MHLLRLACDAHLLFDGVELETDECDRCLVDLVGRNVEAQFPAQCQEPFD